MGTMAFLQFKTVDLNFLKQLNFLLLLNCLLPIMLWLARHLMRAVYCMGYGGNFTKQQTLHALERDYQNTTLAWNISLPIWTRVSIKPLVWQLNFSTA